MNVTVSSHIHNISDVILANQVALYIEKVIFTSNILLYDGFANIISATNSYVQFSGYNEFTNNSVFLAITSSAIHLQENSYITKLYNKHT